MYEADKEDYEAFLCGQNTGVVDEAACAQLVAAGFPTDATDLNLPSIAVSALALGSKTVKRRVTNVGDAGQFPSRLTHHRASMSTSLLPC